MVLNCCDLLLDKTINDETLSQLMGEVIAAIDIWRKNLKVIGAVNYFEV